MDRTQKRSQILLILSLFIAFGCLVFFGIAKGTLVQYFATWHNPGLDKFFLITTRFGEEVALIPALLILFFKVPFTMKEKWRMMLKIIVCLVGMFVVVVVLKQFVFDFDRPFKYFQEQGIVLAEVLGMKLNSHHSFPSGHTATAFFGWYLVFHLLFQGSKLRHLWLIVALMVGFSRIYLGQHFLQDVWAGAVIGFFAAYIAFHWIKSTENVAKNEFNAN